ncbi:hypothetical protein AKJ52_01265 [candidate division MSBL1 archaeon SCGC-AAA382C18]|uniref:MGS-like domain-containing protein n=1 Tax=candidate division MSBL1 archaeon SCGC-AAA382C18 TaxID=1698281 RepID=A0A133VKH5_9EURY|nr:hypothetical protein AKJ52_01265 [candidate division MSBL1 archaeon SCGC-AAA382C18]
MKISTALLSVSEKSGIVDFAKELQDLGIEIICSSGTADFLEQNGIHVKKILDITGTEEILDGRVKTLNQKIHGGILADRNNTEHIEQIKEKDITPIDLVVVNFYSVERKIKNDRPIEEIIEKIDIGGPALVRASAKNYQNVGIVVKPDQYGEIIEELRRNEGILDIETRERLAIVAFSHIADYDESISRYLSKKLSD